MRLDAIIFDVDGTLAETEETHRRAFNRAFAEAGLDWCWSEHDYRRLLTTTGGRERIARYLAERELPADPAAVGALHAAKNSVYADLLAHGAVVPRPGVLRLIDEARRRGITLAIATTTSRDNLRGLLGHVFGEAVADLFSVIVAGEDVGAKKPHPEVYLSVLARLRLKSTACVAIEDSRNGLRAAQAAGLATVITPSCYSAHEDFAGASLMVSTLDDPFGRVDVDALDAILAGSAR